MRLSGAYASVKFHPPLKWLNRFDLPALRTPAPSGPTR